MGRAMYVILRDSADKATLGQDVYVTDVSERVPGYPPRFAFSSSKDVREATRWTYEEGTEAIRTRTWTNARLVLAGEASPLLP